MDLIQNLFNKKPLPNQNSQKFQPVPNIPRKAHNNLKMNRSNLNFNPKPNQFYQQPSSDIQMIDTNEYPKSNTFLENQFQLKMKKIQKNLKKFSEEAQYPTQPKRNFNFNEQPHESNFEQGSNMKRGGQGKKPQRGKRPSFEYGRKLEQEEQRERDINSFRMDNTEDDCIEENYLKEDIDNENDYYVPKSMQLPKKDLNKPLKEPRGRKAEESQDVETKERKIKKRLRPKEDQPKEPPTEVIEKKNIDLSKLIDLQEKTKRSQSPQIPTKEGSLFQHQKIKAQLTTMCSESEIAERESQNLLSIFEIDPSKAAIDPITNIETKKAKPEYAIKAFLRPGGDLDKYDPQNIRTPKTLRETVDYIINNIVDSDNPQGNSRYSQLTPIAFSEICLFANDRFKAIRQDFTVQELKSSKECIESNELIARFLILCLNETLNEKSISGEQGLYALNMVQLNTTLTSLYEFYEFSRNQRDKGISADEYFMSPNEDEFISYFLLMALKQKPIEFISILSKIPKEMQKGKRIAFALSIAKTILSHDWNSFMKRLKSKECDYLTACVMVLFFTDIRFLALTELSYMNKIPPAIYTVSLNQLLHLLPFEDVGECLEFLKWFGVGVPYSSLENTNLRFGLLRKELDLDYNFLHAPMKTNHRYIQMKKGNSARREIIKGNEDHNQLPFHPKETKKEQIIHQPLFIDFTQQKPTDEQKKSPISFKQQGLPFFSQEEIKPTIATFPLINFNSKAEEQETLLPDLFQSIENKEEANFNAGRITYLMSLLDLFVFKARLIRYKYRLLSQLTIFFEQDRIASQFHKAKSKEMKKKILQSWRKAFIKSKYNTIYQKELLKYNMNINSIETTYAMTPKASLSLYTYDELLYFLMENYELNESSSITPGNSIIHLQINIFTTRELLISTEIIQRLNIDQQNVESTEDEIVISSRVNKGERAFYFFMKIIFFDQIATNSLDNYIYAHQQSLSKFSYGLIFFDYANEVILKTFMELLDQSLGDYVKKKFIFAFCIDNSIDNDHFNLIHQSYLSIVNKYYYIDDAPPQTIFLANLHSFSSYFTDLLIHHNNSTFISLFKDATRISFQSSPLNLPSLPLKRIHKSIRIEFNMRALCNLYHFSKTNYLIEEALLSIGLIKTVSLFYKVKLSNDLNLMLNIPSYLTDSRVSAKERVYLQLIKYFDYLQRIDLGNSASLAEMSQGYRKSPLAYLDILVKYLVEYDFTGLFGLAYREAVMKYEFNAKKQFSLSVNNGMFAIVLGFFNEVIRFISDSIGIEIDWSVDDCKVSEEIFNEKKKERIDEVKECIESLVKNEMIPILRMNEMLTSEDFSCFTFLSNNQKNYLNKKRDRVDDNEYFEQPSCKFESFNMHKGTVISSKRIFSPMHQFLTELRSTPLIRTSFDI